ncbi:hypothetical protein BJY04DRAFT_180078 [Aspergillus karnatakaensis]|uniref:uncharacterized protein n=1 Tax=Aspergillus karnatakaensis TaxID=1810916 RepID=UPI003CCDF09D
MTLPPSPKAPCALSAPPGCLSCIDGLPIEPSPAWSQLLRPSGCFPGPRLHATARSGVGITKFFVSPQPTFDATLKEHKQIAVAHGALAHHSFCLRRQHRKNGICPISKQSFKRRVGEDDILSSCLTACLIQDQLNLPDLCFPFCRLPASACCVNGPA